jgi:hypothetical protein
MKAVGEPCTYDGRPRPSKFITGLHGDDPKKVYSELCEVIDDVIAHFEASGRALPAPKVRPMQDVV